MNLYSKLPRVSIVDFSVVVVWNVLLNTGISVYESEDCCHWSDADIASLEFLFSAEYLVP